MSSETLPPNWSWVKLGDVSKRIHYGYTASAENKDVGPKLLRITDIQEGKVDWNEVPYCTIPSNYIHKYLLSENDIVFARTGATVGKSFLIKGKIPPSVFASYLIRLQLSDKTLPKFIYLFFQSNHYWSQIKDSSAGIGQPNVNAQKLSNLNLPLPPLPEQKIIVEKIEELFSGLDSGVASLKKAKEQIRLYRQSVLASAFSGKLLTPSAERVAHSEMLKAAEPKVEYSNRLPDGWKWVKLGEVVKIVSGNTPKGLQSISNTGSLPFYKVSDMNFAGNERKMLKSNLYLTNEEMKKLKIKIYPKHTTIFPKRGGAILTNKKRLLSTDSSFDLNLMGLIPSASVNYQFLHYWIIKLDLSTIYDGSNVPQINNKNVEPLDFPLPPLKQQTQIVEEIEKRFSEADNLEKAIDDSLAKSETLRQSILKQAFSGKLIMNN